MLVEFGNPNPSHTDNKPVVTYLPIPDAYTYVVADSAADLAAEVKSHWANALIERDGITNLPDQEAILIAQAAWRAESRGGKPDWVWSDNDAFAVLLGHFFDCPVGRPDDVEARYFTDAGEPGVSRPAPDEPEATP